MAILIDTCALASVFNCNSGDHAKFKPVLDWIENGNGKIVVGGTKYQSELKKTEKYLRLVNEFGKRGKVIKISDQKIDVRYAKLKKEYAKVGFNDFHIVAIVDISGCPLVCSTNSKDFVHMKKSIYYETNDPPKIFSGSRQNKKLLAVKCKKLSGTI